MLERSNGSPQMRTSSLCSMSIRCRSVDPDRHPADSRKIGRSSHDRVAAEHRASASPRRAARSADFSRARLTRPHALLGPKSALRTSYMVSLYLDFSYFEDFRNLERNAAGHHKQMLCATETGDKARLAA